jgi:alcohol dehydrogenase YqhD (iron-dependent ADH family)
MVDFIYHNPTKIVFGKNKESLIGAEIKAEISVLSHENVVVIPYLVNSKDKNKPYVDIKMIEIIREIIGC